MREKRQVLDTRDRQTHVSLDMNKRMDSKRKGHPEDKIGEDIFSHLHLKGMST